MQYKFEKLALEGLLLIDFPIFVDDRGAFSEIYRQTEFQAQDVPVFVQDNFSFSTKGVLRGLHYQLPPKAQGKLVYVLEGEIFDVAVDIRKASKTFKKWKGFILKAGANQALYVPPGFAHGFLVLSETARVLYKTTAEYAPEAEKGIVWNDSELNIAWPIKTPRLKQRDSDFPTLALADLF